MNCGRTVFSQLRTATPNLIYSITLTNSSCSTYSRTLLIADDDARVCFQIERLATDRKTGKPVADITRYTYRDGDTRYVVTFERQKTILQTVFREEMPLIKRLLAKIVGFDGAYHRFTGKVTIEKFEKDRS